MSRLSFEIYGERARQLADPTLVAGRYSVQKEAERKIVEDVLLKLDVQPGDSLLEIGCSIGNLLIPLSFFVHKCVGVDHSSCLEKLRARYSSENLGLVEGNFLDVKIDKHFDKILCYSVMHYIGREEVFHFIEKALDMLAPGGRALFGDLPNTSLKARFLASEQGKQFDKKWRDTLERSGAQVALGEINLKSDPDTASFDDACLTEFMLRYRTRGFNVYVLPQPPELPFGNTREDLLITRTK